jgi:PAS domain S-box-containing protein
MKNQIPLLFYQKKLYFRRVIHIFSMSKSKSRQNRKIRKIISNIFFIILFIALLAYGLNRVLISYKSSKEDILNTTKYEVQESVSGINETIGLSTSFLRMIQTSYKQIHADVNAFDTKYLPYFNNPGNGSVYSTDSFGRNPEFSSYGNITGIGKHNKLSPSVKHDLQKALLLTPTFNLAIQNIPNLSWIYFNSNKDFIYMYPFEHSRNYYFRTEIYDHQLFTGGTPQTNPEKKLYWTEAYFDKTDKSAMVTASIPMYNDEFSGVLSMDLKLSTLSKHLKGRSLHGAESFLTNEKGQILASPNIDFSNDTSIRYLSEVFPNLKNEFDTIAGFKEGDLIKHHGYFIIKYPIKETNWNLITIRPVNKLNRKVIIGLIPEVIITLLLFFLSIMLYNITKSRLLIRKNERKFRSVFNEIKQIMFVLSPRQRIIDFNMAASNFTGLRRDTNVEIGFFELDIWNYNQNILKRFKEDFAKAKKGEFVRQEYKLNSSLKTEYTFELSLTPILDSFNSTVMIILSAYDITEIKEVQKKLGNTIEELKTTQEQLIMSEKMAAFGQLSAGLAHELNNPLAALQAAFNNFKSSTGDIIQTIYATNSMWKQRDFDFIESLVANAVDSKHNYSTRERRAKKKEISRLLESRGLGSESEMINTFSAINLYDGELLDKILEHPKGRELIGITRMISSMVKNNSTIEYSAKRALNIVSSFKEFSNRELSNETSEFKMQELINGRVSMLDQFIGSKVTLDVELENDFIVKYNRSELKQIVFHLMKNALQAIKMDGEVKVKAGTDGSILFIEVIDNGEGMSEQTKEKLFDPFYTTRETGEGAGLGLYVVQTIVESNLGTVIFDCQPGRTSFRVDLPVQ